MTDEEMYEWYKTGATRQTDMSDEDFFNLRSKAQKMSETNQNNSLTERGHSLLDSNLASSQAGLAMQQKNAQQSASINNSKLMKYLGQKQLASGLATGQTGSDFINANNAYTQNRAAINNNFSAQQAALLQQYGENKLALDDTSFNRQKGINDTWYGRDYATSRDAVGDKRYDTEWAAREEQRGFDNNMTLEQWANSKTQQELDNAYRDKTFASAEEQRAFDNWYKTNYEKDKKEAEDNYAHYSEMLAMYIDDYMKDGNFSDDEYAQATEYLNKFAGTDAEKARLQDALDYHKSSQKSVNGDSAQKADKQKWEQYKSSFNGSQYSGSTPTITDRGYLLVTVDGKQMYAYQETADVKGSSSGADYGWAWILGPYAPAVVEGSGAVRKSEVEKWVSAAKAGVLPDGAVIDTKSGSQNLHVMYYKDKFYIVGDNAGKAMGGFN